MEQLQHLWGIAYGIRRKLATWGLFLFAGLLAVHVIFGTNGWMAYEKKKAEFRKVNTENQELQTANERLQDHIEKLKNDPKTIEKEAREQFGYARNGEVILTIQPRKQESTATAQANQDTKK